MLAHYRILLRNWPLIRYLVNAGRKSNVFRMALGGMWNFLNPLAHVVIYYFLVVVVFKAQPRQGISPFILIMMGVIHYSFVQNSLAAAGTSIFERETILLQIKVEPIVFVAGSFYDSLKDFSIALVIYFAAHLIMGPSLDERALWYPVLLVLMIAMSWSSCLLMAMLTVHFRDLQNIVQIGLRVMMYAVPVLYTVDFVPERFRIIYLWNPLGCLFAMYQWCLLGAERPPLVAIAAMTVFAGLLLTLAHVVYGRLCLQLTKVL